MTYREQFESAMKCETEDEAKTWLDAEVKRCVFAYGQSPDEARMVILHNLGYMAGYYDPSYSQKVFNLFGAHHPFGLV